MNSELARHIEAARKIEPDAQAISRLAQLRNAHNESPRIAWAGTELPLQLRVLTCSEIQECQAHALRRFKELDIPLDRYSEALFLDEIAVQVLFRACRDVENPEQTFAVSPEDLRDNTNVYQRTAMFKMYDALVAEVDPDPETVPLEVYERIRELQKKKDAIQLSSFASRILAHYMTTTGALPSD